MDSKLLSPAEVADLLQVPESRLARWRSKGVGPDYVKIEGRVSYSVGAIGAFVDRSTVRLAKLVTDSAVARIGRSL